VQISQSLILAASVGEVVGLEDDFDHAFVLADDFEDCVDVLRQ